MGGLGGENGQPEDFREKALSSEDKWRTAFLVARSAHAKALRLEIILPRVLLLVQPLPVSPVILLSFIGCCFFEKVHIPHRWNVFSNLIKRVFCFSSVSSSAP